MKNIIIIIILLAVGFGLYSLTNRTEDGAVVIENELSEETNPEENMDQEKEVVPAEVAWARKETIGASVEGKDIVAYQYGTGEKELLFVGGIHGGYSWNTATVAYDLIDYIENNEGMIADDIQVTVIPVLNPDGLSDIAPNYASGVSSSDISASETAKVASRFNANKVDLNRNFDCDWQENAKWQNKDVSGGGQVFSEPETRAIRDYVSANNPTSVVVYYSAAGGVFSSSCHNGVLPETTKITELYAKASGYKAYDKFDFYATTGDLVNWLAKEGIPAVSVLLTTHESPETNKNIEGFKALLNYYK